MPKNPEKFEPEIEKPSEEKEKAEIEPERLEDDPRFKQILEEKSLDYLKTKDSKWFYSEYSGEIASSGYLIDKKGKETNLLPSQCIGKEYEKIKKEAVQEFSQQYPDVAEGHGVEFKPEAKKEREEESEEELEKAREEAGEIFEEEEKKKEVPEEEELEEEK